MSEKWRGWPRLLSIIKSKKRILLLLDFDGTLAPIVSLPRNARLAGNARNALMRLQARPRVTVAIVSGRSLRDLQKKIALPGAYYAGNHGLEISGPGTAFEYPGIRKYVKTIESLARHLKKLFKSVPGTLVQNKRLSLSVHYRNVKARDLWRLNRLVKQSLIDTARLDMVWRKGRKVYEILPGVDWNKGCAALWLLKKLKNPFPLAFGDDKTDDTMFRALKNKGITTRIGRKRKLAHYSLKDPESVCAFLHALEMRLQS